MKKTGSLCLFVLSFAMLIFSCRKTDDYKTLDALQWLEGKWVAQVENSKLFESWEKENDSTLRGFAFQVENKDTVFAENMLLMQRKGKILYSVTTPGQSSESNNTVDFTLISDSASTWIFENPQHDFPQRITYKQTSEDALHARIEGAIKANPTSQDFYFSRITE